MLEVRPGRPVDPSIAGDIVVVPSTAPSTPPAGWLQKENEDPTDAADRRGKLGRWLDATSTAASASMMAVMQGAPQPRPVLALPTEEAAKAAATAVEYW